MASNILQFLTQPAVWKLTCFFHLALEAKMKHLVEPCVHISSHYLRCRSRHTSATQPWEPSWSTLWHTALRMSSAEAGELGRKDA